MRVSAITALFLMPLLPGAILGQGAAAQPENQPELRGYTCCNLHYEDDWISDANWSSLPMIPAGTPIRTSSYARYSITVEIDHPWYTRKMRLGLDYGRKQRLADWARLIIVPENPKPRIATWPEHIRNAVRDGQVAIGMTKEQLIVAVGYPPAHETPSLDAPQWKYWHTTHGTFNVIWSETDHVEDVIDGDPFNPMARAAMLAAGAPSMDASPPSRPSPPSGLLPPTGTQWTYRFVDRVYPRNNAIVAMRVLRSDSRLVEESVATMHGATQAQARSRVIDARVPRILEYSMSDGGGTLIELSPYLFAFDDQSGAIQGITGYPRGNAELPDWVYSARVHGWEEVIVPAGTFRALRIDVRGERATSDLPVQGAVTGRFELILWYAPSVQRYVKLEHRTWSGAFSTRGQQTGHELTELLKFSPPS